MQTAAIRTVANSLPQNEAILLTLLISKRYIPYTDLRKINGNISTCALQSLHLCRRIAFAVQSGCVRRPIGLRSVSDRVAFGVR